MAVILDGLKVSKEIKEEIKREVFKLSQNGKRKPHLAAILVGSNAASITYVDNKIRDCKEVGFESTMVRLPSTVSEAELLEKITELNQDKNLDGFIVQLPLPDQMDQEKIIMAIDPNKDVDGFHPENFGKMALEMSTFLPATPYGILSLLERYQIETKGKDCVIIGRSRIVGRPMSILMGRKDFPGNSTVTLTHSYTKEIETYTKNADIIITALGTPRFLKAEMIKEGAIVIDVGITRIENPAHPKGYELVGDVDFEDVKTKAAFITPVPGGVGPMTRAMLLKNTLLAYKKRND